VARKDISADEIATFLERPLVATLATYRKDGTILLSPVWQEWSDGAMNIVISAGDVKARHIARDPRASVAVYEDDPPYAGIELRGVVRILEADAHELNRRLAIRYMGSDRGERYSQSTKHEDRLWLRVEGTLRAWDYRDIWPN